MSKIQKVVSERKHKMVHNFLVRNFPKCDVKYDGIEGIDHTITFNGKPTFIETKTCKKIIRSGVTPDITRPVLHQNVRLGTFKFYQRSVYPYELSQHADLIKSNGWYIFVVGQKIFGANVYDVDREIGGHWQIKQAPWSKMALICFPDWLEKLKMQVYDVEDWK